MDATEKKPFINALLDNYLDSRVYHDVLKTYSKETITFIDYGNLSITNMSSDLINQVQFTETEISPFHKHDIDCEDHIPTETMRMPSLAVFDDKKIDFADLRRLLIRSFSPNQGTRPYPSAGGLYCVEPLVFLFQERISHFDNHVAGCYHFRPVSKKLQLIKPMSISFFYDKLIHGYMKNNHLPCLGILYLVNISKALFKYRYRGYRHSLMEIGSMYQQATLCSEDMGLRNTVWSTFSDQEMLYALELDHGAYMPMTMQFFGYSES
jgi:SagB-type dehydrogenase family enzyme